MKPSVACNYVVVRFLPYPESGEFVNIGVVVNSPQTGFFDFRLERKKFRRIAHFFPELHSQVYREGLAACAEEIGRIRGEIGVYGETADQMLIDPGMAAGLFRELVRPRESIIRFSDPGTVLTPEPAALLDELFGQYVERMFAQEQDYQEEIMRKRVLEMLKAHQLISRFKQAHRVGNEEYGVRFPFVTEPRLGVVEKAIKPLNLGQSDTSKMYDHGELWVNRIRRLRKMNAAPQEVLFTVTQAPQESRKQAAYVEICDQLKAQGALVLEARDESAVLRFAADA